MKTDLNDQRFGRWIVLAHVEGNFWQCQCDCGTLTIRDAEVLRNGSSRSCGCLRRELWLEQRFKHGEGGQEPKSTTFGDASNKDAIIPDPSITGFMVSGALQSVSVGGRAMRIF